MGSYVAFYLAGLYPLPGTRQILIASPYFPEISFYNPLYKSKTTIRSRGFSGNPKTGTGGKVFVKVRSSSYRRIGKADEYTEREDRW
jgi:hypothetical protein